MRTLVVMLVVLGCRGGSPAGGPGSPGGGSGSGAPPAVPASPVAPASPDVAAIAALADQACACKDAPCRDHVHHRWKAAAPAPQAAGDPARMTQQQVAAEVEHDMAYHAARARLYSCLEPAHDAPAVTARVKAFADRACGCARDDAACLDKVKLDFDRYLEVAWLLQDDYSSADKQALQAEMRNFERCQQVGPT